MLEQREENDSFEVDSVEAGSGSSGSRGSGSVSVVELKRVNKIRDLLSRRPMPIRWSISQPQTDEHRVGTPTPSERHEVAF